MVNRMDISHAVFDDPTEFLETFVVAHTRYCATVDEDVTLGEEFESF